MLCIARKIHHKLKSPVVHRIGKKEHLLISLIDYFINELRHRDLSSFLPEVMRSGDWDIDQPILNRTKQLQQKEGKNNFMFNAVVPS